MPRVMLHDPQADLDYSIDWTARLQTGETITEATWTLPTDTGAPTRVDGQSDILSGPIATIWITGGTLGLIYDITCHATTSLGRQYDATIQLIIDNR